MAGHPIARRNLTVNKAYLKPGGVCPVTAVGTNYCSQLSVNPTPCTSSGTGLCGGDVDLTTTTTVVVNWVCPPPPFDLVLISAARHVKG